MLIKSAHAELFRMLVVDIDVPGLADEDRRNHVNFAMTEVKTTKNTEALVDFLSVGQRLIDEPKSRYAADLELVIPQALLTLIAKVLTGEIKATYRPRKTVDKMRPSTMKRAFEQLAVRIRDGLENPALRKDVFSQLKDAGWSKNYPEKKGAITVAARLLLSVQLDCKDSPEALIERLKLTPRKKIGK